MPETPEELWNFCKIHFGMHFPRKQIAEYATPPFELLWKLYNQEIRLGMGIGPRGGSKTTLSAANHTLSALRHNECEIACIAAEKQQARAGYRQVLKFIHGTRPWQNFEHMIDGKMKQSESDFKNGSRISIVSGTCSGVNSAHVHRLTFDEIDLIEDASVYEESIGMMADAREGLIPQRVYISSWKKPEWMVTKLREDLENDPEALVAVWTWKEVCKPCTDDCNECKSVVRNDISFWDICQGSVKNADGFLNPRYYRDAFKLARLSTWRSQYESKEPEIDNPVYPGLDERNIREVNYNSSYPYFIGVDFGTRDPNCAIFGQYIEGVWHIFKEIYIRHLRLPDFAMMIKDACMALGAMPETIWGDRQGAPGRNEIYHAMPNHVAVTHLYYFTQILDGIGIVSEAIDGMTPSGVSTGKRLFIDRSCKKLISEMKGYRFTDSGKPAPGDDHAPDALRYLVAGYEEVYLLGDNYHYEMRMQQLRNQKLTQEANE